MIIPLIMSGGSGTRLWPLSRGDHPKQFHALVDAHSMFIHTMRRLESHSEALRFDRPVVVLNHRHLTLVQESLKQQGLSARSIVVEPFGRNTAPAVAAALRASGDVDPQALMLMLPADHLIANVAAFHAAIQTGAKAASDGALVTFGIVPDRPDTGFGYIRRGEADDATYRVDAFVEKPDLETAKSYVASGKYSWNAGIFLFRADVMAREIQSQRPQMWQGIQDAVPQSTTEITHIDREAFAKIEGESIDYAVMENAARVNVVPVEMGWDDIGSWSQLYAVSPKDQAGNARIGDIVTIDSKDCYLRSERGLLATVGVTDLVVVQTGDATIVANKTRSQDVKKVVDELKAAGRTEMEVTPLHVAPRLPASMRTAEVRQWLYATALPFWSEAMFDPRNGGVVERLTRDGKPKLDDDFVRLRVWARQIYVYAHAKMLGWDGPADEILDRMFAHLTNHGWHSDGGWIHVAAPDGQVRDDRRDTYDHAFVLLGLAHMAKATGRADVRTWFERTLEFVDTKLADRVHGGFIEGLPAEGPRRANPHMHLLEAWLACYELTGEHEFLQRATAMVDLFDRHFFDTETWTVTEFFQGPAWGTLADKQGQVAEPGHHYEWIWLLKRYESMSGHSRHNQCLKLFAFAESFGRNRASGLVYDEVNKDGTFERETSRCWPQTEALKALLALDKSGVQGLGPRIDEALSHLLDTCLAGTVPGAWRDQFDGSGKAIAETIPVSTFYHVFCALAELLAHNKEQHDKQ